MKRIALLKQVGSLKDKPHLPILLPEQRVKEIPRHLPCGYYYLYHSHEHCLPFLHSELVYPDRDINRGWHMDIPMKNLVPMRRYFSEVSLKQRSC